MTADITLVDKVIVVTGASRGIGAAIATAAANVGASVALASRKAASADPTSPTTVMASSGPRAALSPSRTTG